MGQKVNPVGLRLGINRTWDSRWYANRREYGKLLHEDMKIRNYLREQLKQAGVSKVLIERPHKKCRVTIYSARPGGRAGGVHVRFPVVLPAIPSIILMAVAPTAANIGQRLGARRPRARRRDPTRRRRNSSCAAVTTRKLKRSVPWHARCGKARSLTGIS